MAAGSGELPSGDGIPRARVVRDGSAPIPRPVIRDGVRDHYRRVEPALRTVATYLVGLWPLVVAVVVGGLLLWSAGYEDPTLGR